MRDEWICCNKNYEDLIPIIKQTKNCDKRLHTFQNMIKEEKLIFSVWDLINKLSISDYAEKQFYCYEDDIDRNADFTYYFFNVFTGEAAHFTYKVRITCSFDID